MGCCSSIPDIEGRFPAIEIVSILNKDENKQDDPVTRPGPNAEQFEDLNFSDSSSVEADMEHLSKLLTPKKNEESHEKTSKKKSKK